MAATTSGCVGTVPPPVTKDVSAVKSSMERVKVPAGSLWEDFLMATKLSKESKVLYSVSV